MRSFGRWFASKKGRASASPSGAGVDERGGEREGNENRGGFLSRGMRALSHGSLSSAPDRAGGGADTATVRSLSSSSSSSSSAHPSPRRTSASVGAWSDLLTPPEDRSINNDNKRQTRAFREQCSEAEQRRARYEADELVTAVINSMSSSGKTNISSGDEAAPTRLCDFVREHGERGGLCEQHDSDLFLALVLRGVAGHERGELWLSASGGKKLMLANAPGHYACLTTSASLPADDERTAAAIKQIDLDVGRTKGLQQTAQEKDGQRQKALDKSVPASGETDGDDSGGFAAGVSLESLRSVLVATSRQLPHIGYCQSMNFLGAMLLEQLDEEEAFWVLVAMADDMLSGYYTLSLIGCRVDQRVFADLVATIMPEVSRRVDEIMGLPSVGILSYHWFLTLFLTTMENHDTLLRIWDVFFARGSRALFQIALSVFENASPAICEADEIQDISIAIADALHSYSGHDVVRAVLGLYGAVVSQTKVDFLRLKHLSALREEEAEMQRKLDSIKNARNNTSRASMVHHKSMRRLGSLTNMKKYQTKNRRVSCVSEVMGVAKTNTHISSDDDSGLEDEDVQVEHATDIDILDRVSEELALGAPTHASASLPHAASAAAELPQNDTSIVNDGDSDNGKKGAERDESALVLTLDDLIDIERVVLDKMRQNQEQNGLAETEIDGRTLCRVDRVTFTRVWASACRVSERVEHWAQVHVSRPEDIFEAFCSVFEDAGAGSPSAVSTPPTRVPMVDFRELLCGLSVLCSGATREAKLRFIYKIYDTDRNQTLDADELYDMMHAVYSMFLSNSGDSAGAVDSVDIVEKEVNGFVRLVFAKLLHSGGSSNGLEGKRDVDAGLSFAQFREVSVMQPLILQYLMSDDLGASVTVSSVGASSALSENGTAPTPTIESTDKSKSVSRRKRGSFRRKDSMELHERDVRARIQQMHLSEDAGHSGDGGEVKSPVDTSLHSSLMKYSFVMSMERNLIKPGKVPAQMALDWNALTQGLSRSLSSADAMKVELKRERQAHDALDMELEEAEQRVMELEEELRMEREKSRMNEALLRNLIAKTSDAK